MCPVPSGRISVVGTSSSGQPSTVLVCGPSPQAGGGGPAHIRNLWASPLSRSFRLEFLQTGSRGQESPAVDEPLIAAVLRLIASPFELAARIASTRPAVVHINSATDKRGFMRDAVLLAVAKLFRRRVVYQLHGWSIYRLTGRQGMRMLARAVFRLPDAVVVLANVTVPQFKALGTVRRIEFVPNGVDVPALTGEVPREHSGRVQRLGYLGRLVDSKGIKEAIDAVAILRADPGFEALELWIAGSGDARRLLEDHASLRGVGSAVRFVGTVSGEAKLSFLRDTDILILISPSEGMPYSILEAMATGTPVVASAVGGIVDVVRDGIDGRIVPPQDAEALAAVLRELDADPAVVRAMSAAAAARISEDFSLERLAGRFGSIYRSLGAHSTDRIS